MNRARKRLRWAIFGSGGLGLIGALTLYALMGGGALAQSMTGAAGTRELQSLMRQTTSSLTAKTTASDGGAPASRNQPAPPVSEAHATPTIPPTPPPSTPPPRTSAHMRTLQTIITFYAAYDNDPPGSRTIAYPGPAPRHSRATAYLGTYNHPITLASDKRWLPVGTRVYVVSLHKYYIMEDECVSAELQYSASRTKHVDLYLTSSTSSGVADAEEDATGNDRVKHTIVINPPPNLPVDTTPLYSESGGSAYDAHHYGETLP